MNELIKKLKTSIESLIRLRKNITIVSQFSSNKSNNSYKENIDWIISRFSEHTQNLCT